MEKPQRLNYYKVDDKLTGSVKGLLICPPIGVKQL